MKVKTSYPLQLNGCSHPVVPPVNTVLEYASRLSGLGPKMFRWTREGVRYVYYGMLSTVSRVSRC
jgi:hypothetical protein